jgi:hypothetical protein
MPAARRKHWHKAVIFMAFLEGRSAVDVVWESHAVPMGHHLVTDLAARSSALLRECSSLRSNASNARDAVDLDKKRLENAPSYEMNEDFLGTPRRSC